MNTTEHVSPTNTLSPSDPRAVFAAAVRTAGELIATVQPHQTGLPTPCADIDVSGMFGHLLMVLERVTALGAGRDSCTRGLLTKKILILMSDTGGGHRSRLEKTAALGIH